MRPLGLVDAVAAGVLALFVVWGLRRGPLRQVGSLVLLAAAFPLAAHFGPLLEDRVVRAVSERSAPPDLVAWGVVFVGVLLLGGLALALAQPLLRRPDARPGWGGALLGLVHGILVLSVLGYGVLLAFSASDRSGWVRRIEASQTGWAMRQVVKGIRTVAPIPPGVEGRLREVDDRIGG